ncbi:hypothetical protein GJAV_G00199300 [Gymnothorax javanicus]|nr:hypothetical protein GJAV_G00199300 [Gymnothorax javanicus]
MRFGWRYKALALSGHLEIPVGGSVGTLRCPPSANKFGRSTLQEIVFGISFCCNDPLHFLRRSMPEHMITEETLPSLLMEIRQKKALKERSCPSSSSRSSCHQPPQPSSHKWESSARTSSTEYSTVSPKRSSFPPVPSPHSSYPLAREEVDCLRDRWGNPMQTSAGRQEKASTTYVVDYNYGQPQEGSSQNLEKSAYSAKAACIGGQRDQLQSSSDYWQAYQGKQPSALYPTNQDLALAATAHSTPTAREAYSARTAAIEERLPFQTSSDYRQVHTSKEPAALYQKSKDQNPPLPSSVHSTPTAREANDFHGAVPQTFPYACSLCDIAVLSQKDWTVHINGSQHAESQLVVLQMYPDWDCRTKSARPSYPQSERSRKEKNAGERRQGASQHYGVPSSYESKSYSAGEEAGGKVVCAKYAANSMDELALRRLVDQVGTAVNVMMFPVQAFIEMSSPEEAEDVVKYFRRNPVIVEGSPVQFSMSATYNFLQKSPVVVFSSLPPGNDKYPEIMAIAKRFGPVSHSLLLPNRMLLEMGSREIATKLVQYFTSSPLKIKGRTIQASHSTKHSSLKFEVTGKKAEDGVVSRHNKIRSSLSPRRKSPTTREKYFDRRKRSPSPRRPYSPKRRSHSPRRRSYSPRRRSPSPRRRSPIERKRSSVNRRRSPSPRRKSWDKQDGARKSGDKASREGTRPLSKHRSQSRRRSVSHTRESRSISKGHSAEKITDTPKVSDKRTEVLPENPDLGSSQEPSCTPDQTNKSVANPKEHCEIHSTDQETPEQTGAVDGGGNESDMDSDIEGMAVIGEDEVMMSGEDSEELQEEMEEPMCDEDGAGITSGEDPSAVAPESAEASEEDKEVEGAEQMAVLPDEVPGSQSPTVDPTLSEKPGLKPAKGENEGEGQVEVDEPNEGENEGEGQVEVDEPNEGESEGDGQVEVDEPNEGENEGEGQVEVDEPNEGESEGDGQVEVDEPNEGENEGEGQVEVDEPNEGESEGDGQVEVDEPNEASEEDEPDFPESLEHCITLDELEDVDDESQELRSDVHSGRRSRKEAEEHDKGRVLYIRDLPAAYYTDKDFLRIARKYGRVNRYLLIRRNREGFIEMERSDDAVRAVRDLERKVVKLDHYTLSIRLSQKYKKLTSGWKPDSDSEEEAERKRHREKRKRGSEDGSKTKSRKEEEPPAKKTRTKEERTTPVESKRGTKEEKNNAAKEPSSNRAQQQRDKAKKAVIEELGSNNEQQQQKEKADTTELNSKEKRPQEEKVATEEPSPCEDQQVQEEVVKTAAVEPSSTGEQQQVEEAEEAATAEPSGTREQQLDEEETSEIPAQQKVVVAKTENEEVKISQSSNSMESSEKGTVGESNSENAGVVHRACVEKVEMKTEPVHVPLGSYLPNNPMGREFISQKIGYFCSLCNVIYVTEDEARNVHCSSLSHYEQFKAHMEKMASH